MKFSAPMESTGASPAPITPTLSHVTVFKAVANPLRWQLLLMLADGRMLSATQAAGLLHRDIDIVIKHLNILRNAGVLDRKTSDQDARFLLYFIPQQWRLRAGVLDFGCCILNLPPS